MHICLSAGGPSSWVWFIPENDSDSELVFNYKKRIPAILILKGLVLFLQLGLNKWRGLFFGLLASFFPSMFQLIKEPHTSFTNLKNNQTLQNLLAFTEWFYYSQHGVRPTSIIASFEMVVPKLQKQCVLCCVGRCNESDDKNINYLMRNIAERQPF